MLSHITTEKQRENRARDKEAAQWVERDKNVTAPWRNFHYLLSSSYDLHHSHHFNEPHSSFIVQSRKLSQYKQRWVRSARQMEKRENFSVESTNILQRFSNEWNQSIIDRERDCKQSVINRLGVGEIWKRAKLQLASFCWKIELQGEPIGSISARVVFREGDGTKVNVHWLWIRQWRCSRMHKNIFPGVKLLVDNA